MKTMNTTRRSALHRILGALVATTALTFGSAAMAQEAGKLRIWINADKGHKGLQKVGDKFKAATGVEVIVEVPDRPTDRFAQTASVGKGPDIFFWAHDRMGDWAAAGLLAPVTQSAAVKADTLDLANRAFQWNGKQWGYPLAVESIGLIYNKDLVANPPKTFEEIAALDAELQKKSKKAILWDYNNVYFTWPMLAANGGFIFGPKGTDYNTAVTGVNHAGAVQGATFVKEMVDKGIMPKGASYSVMEAGFIGGNTAMMISGPWSWENLRKNNINFGVAPLPTIGGKAPKPMVGVLGAMISASSPNKDLATEFLEKYVLVKDGLAAIDQDVPLGVPASKSFYETLKGNERIAATLKNAEAGEPMPNVPAMGKFWSSMETALQNITAGRQSPKEALDAAAARIVN